MSEELADPGRRKDRLARALGELEGERRAAQAAEQDRAREYLDRGGAGPPPVAAAVEAARRAVAEAIAAQQAKIDQFAARAAAADAAGGLLAAGRRPAPVEQAGAVRTAYQRLARAEARVAEHTARHWGEPKPRRNTTDVDSRLMPVRGGGFIQGYNAQAVFTEDGLAMATDITQDTTDVGSFTPMRDAACQAATLLDTVHTPPSTPDTSPDPGDEQGPGPQCATHSDSPTPPVSDTAPDPGGQPIPAHRPGGIGLFLADAGYLCEDNLTAPGPDRLIAVGKHRDQEKAATDHPAHGPHPPRRPSPSRWLTGCAPPKASPATAAGAPWPKDPSATTNTTA